LNRLSLSFKCWLLKLRPIKHAIWIYRRTLPKYGCFNTERSLF
jgi:hypothetical protein